VASFNSDLHSLLRVTEENIRLCVSNSTSEIFDRFTLNLAKNIMTLEAKLKPRFFKLFVIVNNDLGSQKIVNYQQY
jgi:hypothetical protein